MQYMLAVFPQQEGLDDGPDFLSEEDRGVSFFFDSSLSRRIKLISFLFVAFLNQLLCTIFSFLQVQQRLCVWNCYCNSR